MEQKNTSVVFYLKQCIRQKIGWLIAAVFALLFITVFNILKVYFIEEVANSLGNNQAREITNTFFLLILAMGIGIVASYCETYTIKKFSLDVINKLRKNLFQKVLYSDERTLKNKHSGNIASIFTVELFQLEDFLTNKLHGFIYYPLIFLAGVAYMFIINAKLTFVSIIVIPPLLLVSRRLARNLKKYSENAYNSLEITNLTAHDYIQGVDTVKAYNLDSTFLYKYKKYANQTWEWQKKSHRTNSILLPFVILSYELPIIVCAIYGGILCLITNEINAGSLIAFIQLLGYIIQPLANIPELFGSYMKTKGAITRINELEQLCEETIGLTKEIPTSIIETQNIIEFDNVTFSYDKKVNVLEQVTFIVPRNSKVGLVGTSGSGKSTIFELILGFYMDYEGSIKVMGKEVKEWNVGELRKEISVCLKDDYLFSDTIYNNLKLAYTNATNEEIMAVLKDTNIYDLIFNSDNRLDTKIGSGGRQLSGGEKQRLFLARALLKKSDLLLLDEPSSALDKKTEEKIIKIILKRTQNQAVFCITHRLKTIEQADIVYVLDKNHIVEKGTHKELLENNSIYAKLYSEQFEEVADKLYG